MKIDTKLKFAVGVPVIIAILIGITLFFTTRAEVDAQRNGDLVRQMRSSISSLNSLVFSYAVYHEERPQIQFAAEFKTINDLIDSTSFRDKKEQTLLNSIDSDAASINSLFQQIVAAHSLTPGPGQQDSQQVQLLWGQLLVKWQDMDASASLLRKLTDDDVKNAQTQAVISICALLIAATIP